MYYKPRRARYRLIAVALALFCTLFLCACAASQNPPQSPALPESSAGAQSEDAYQKITAEQAKQMIDQGGVIVVDVRTAEEYEQAHIPGALLVENETSGNDMPAALPDKQAALIVYCRTGVRSKQAADKLVALGYQHVYDMGGIVDWHFATESGAAE